MSSEVVTNRTAQGLVRVMENGTLVIRRARKSLEGRYTCRALNRLDQELTAAITIAVHGEHATPPPVFFTQRLFAHKGIKRCCPGAGARYARPFAGSVSLFDALDRDRDGAVGWRFSSGVRPPFSLRFQPALDFATR